MDRKLGSIEPTFIICQKKYNTYKESRMNAEKHKDDKQEYMQEVLK